MHIFTHRREVCEFCQKGVDEVTRVDFSDTLHRRKKITIVTHTASRRNVEIYQALVSDYVAQRAMLCRGYMPLAKVWGNFWPKSREVISLPQMVEVGKSLEILIINVNTRKVVERIVSKHPVAHVQIEVYRESSQGRSTE